MILDWLYMGNNDSIAAIEASLKDEYDVEVWSELGVVEVTKDKASVDFEMIPQNRWDDFCNEYAKSNGFEQIFQVSVDREAEQWFEEIFKSICKKNGGRFCADSEDLTPCIE